MKKTLLASLLCFSVSANAAFLTGNNLYERMNGSEADRDFALGYVVGVFDATQNVHHCAGARVTSGQMRDLAKKFIEEMPSVRDMPADLLVTAILAQTYPCQKKKT